MDFWSENLIMYLLMLICFILSILGMAGNLWLLVVAGGYAFYSGFHGFDVPMLLWLLGIFCLGELWEFFIGFFGVKRKDIPWSTVGLIGVGTVVGSAFGTLLLPIFGSILGGAAGACLVAYVYEYQKNHNDEHARNLAWRAFKAQLLAALGKILTSIAMLAWMIMHLRWY